jgi:ATP-dependent DNA ligase
VQGKHGRSNSARAHSNHPSLSLFTRAGNDWTARFRPIAAVLAGLKVRTAYLDGEIAALTAEGVSDFEAPQLAPVQSAKGRLVYVVFDICTSPDAIRVRCRS